MDAHANASTCLQRRALDEQYILSKGSILAEHLAGLQVNELQQLLAAHDLIFAHGAHTKLGTPHCFAERRRSHVCAMGPSGGEMTRTPPPIWQSPVCQIVHTRPAASLDLGSMVRAPSAPLGANSGGCGGPLLRPQQLLRRALRARTCYGWWIQRHSLRLARPPMTL